MLMFSANRTFIVRSYGPTSYAEVLSGNVRDQPHEALARVTQPSNCQWMDNGEEFVANDNGYSIWGTHKICMEFLDPNNRMWPGDSGMGVYDPDTGRRLVGIAPVGNTPTTGPFQNITSGTKYFVVKAVWLDRTTFIEQNIFQDSLAKYSNMIDLAYPFVDAEAACSRQGLRLSRMDSSTEDADLEFDMFLQGLEMGNSYAPVWTAGCDALNEGDWRWWQPWLPQCQGDLFRVHSSAVGYNHPNMNISINYGKNCLAAKLEPTVPTPAPYNPSDLDYGWHHDSCTQPRLIACEEQCTTTAQCAPGQTCDPATNQCGCPTNAPFYHSGACRQCSPTGGGCPSGLICNFGPYTCVQCTVSSQCAAGQSCVNNTCVP